MLIGDSCRHCGGASCFSAVATGLSVLGVCQPGSVFGLEKAKALGVEVTVKIWQKTMTTQHETEVPMPLSPHASPIDNDGKSSE